MHSRGGIVFKPGTEACMFEGERQKMLAVLLWNADRNGGKTPEK